MTKTHHPVSVRIADETLNQINTHRGELKLSHWLHSAIQLKLSTSPVGSPSYNQMKSIDSRVTRLEQRVTVLDGGTEIC